jgi:hypothetical protein
MQITPDSIAARKASLARRRIAHLDSSAHKRNGKCAGCARLAREDAAIFDARRATAKA